MQEHNVVQHTGIYVPVHIRTVHVILEKKKMYNIMHFSCQTYDITCIYIHITLPVTALMISVIAAIRSHQ